MAGAAMQGQRGDPNSMEFSNYLFSSGGAYVDDKGKSALNSPAGNKAMTLYADAIKNAAQTGALSATLDDTVRLMCSGKAFSMLTYWWMLPQLDNATACPAVAGKLALTTVLVVTGRAAAGVGAFRKTSQIKRNRPHGPLFSGCRVKRSLPHAHCRGTRLFVPMSMKTPRY